MARPHIAKLQFLHSSNLSRVPELIDIRMITKEVLTLVHPKINKPKELQRERSKRREEKPDNKLKRRQAKLLRKKKKQRKKKTSESNLQLLENHSRKVLLLHAKMTLQAKLKLLLLDILKAKRDLFKLLSLI